MTEWFADWFGHTYLEVYPHRDDEDAKLVIGLIGDIVPLDGLRVLDLACGQGRHAVQLDALGAKTTGVDLSAVLLKRARLGNPPVRDLVRADMRCLPFRNESFDAVVNLFTSFGYFEDDEQHANVVKSVAELLVSGGWFVLDFLNAHLVRQSLVSAEQMKLNGKTVSIKRELLHDGAYVQKTMHVVEDGSEHVERVRLFSADDLSAMVGNTGLQVIDWFGDYHGGPLTPDAPRALLFARKS